jgi:hypothetical protein
MWHQQIEQLVIKAVFSQRQCFYLFEGQNFVLVLFQFPEIM